MEEHPRTQLPSPGELPLPTENEITIRWLSEHIPLRWWLAIAAACGAVLVAAFWAGQQFAAMKSASEVRERMVIKQDLEREIIELQGKKLGLESNIARLEAELEVAKMSPEEVREALRNWTK